MSASSPSARAQASQQLASDPGVSAFVAASAGSGKTKLLIDRLLRLMMDGANPGRILCLTYTKAAAAEMALRLQARLGEWVTLPDPALADRLAALDVTPDAAALARARALFAQVLDLPGGMRISTIHAFCQSLLRRFPLEAALPPQFRLLEDSDGRAELLRAREAALGSADGAALAMLAGLASEADFGKLVADLQLRAAGLAPLLAMPGPARLARLQRALGVRGDEAGLLARAVAFDDTPLRDTITKLRRNGSATEATFADGMFGWLNCDQPLRIEHWMEWTKLFLTAEHEARKPGGVCRSKYAKGDPTIAGSIAAEAARVFQVEDDRRALRAAAATDALLTLAAPILQGFARRKQLAAAVDYTDLIARTRDLLVDPGAAWVLFKLDGGLDHLLLDEVQDTAPEQWEIAGALTAEFFAGEAAREATRTVFAVGDRKQSIFSFQGADPSGFDTWRGRIGERVRGAGEVFRDTALDVSFRSTDAVLGLVDAVFADPVAAAGVVAPGEALRHVPHRAGQAGRVELWPLVPRPSQEPPEAWAVAEANHGLVTGPQRLAEGLAQWIAARVGQMALPARGRMLQAGDVLVLVRRRDDFARALVRRLKGLGVPVAGLDRLYLTQQPAVQDLLALLDTLLLPNDDLSLACVLTSPLGELDDDDLMALAIGREGSLWSALHRRRRERPAWDRVAGLLATLYGRVDFVSPHALLVEALGPLGARSRLLRRLGPEAADPIDELLGAAVNHAAAHPPSLQGFVHWLRQSGAEVKRQAAEEAGTVRVMTVHGSKGLQAPLVILPDTTVAPPSLPALTWPEPGLPLWRPNKAFRSAASNQARAAGEQARQEEANRLLYVGLTRAEDRLVVCGWALKSERDTSWYKAVQRGMAALPAAREPLAGVDDPWEGEVLAYETTQQAAVAPVPLRDATEQPVLPRWAGAPPDWLAHPVPSEPARPTPLAPSRPADALLGPIPHAASPLAGGVAARERGALVHRLLQHAGSLPLLGRDAAVAGYLRRVGGPAALAGEIAAILDHPVLAPLFGPASRAQQPIAGLIGEAIVSGVVDRLVVLPGQVLVADFKTNRDAPLRPEQTPVLYLRQMAAYRAVLRAAFPGHAVSCSLVWTREAAVMPLPDALLDRHAPGALDPPVWQPQVTGPETGVDP